MAADAANVTDVQKVSAGIKPLLLLVGIAAAVAAGVGVVLWSQSPTYNLLYGNLSAEDTSSVTQALAAANIPYRLEGGTGAVSVPVDRVNDARLLLAGQGLPESTGFASMAKDPGFGVSQFMESARYQHALETELARTIASLQQVEGARVHIAAARNSSFVRDRQPGSASVFLQLRTGRRLSTEQVTSIVNLVASSVPELGPEQVTVVDQTGRLLSSPQGRDEFSIRDQQIEFARQMEEGYAQRIEGLLAPLVGAGRVRAQVSAQFDMSAVEEAREQYRPESQIVRSEQLAEDIDRGGAAGPGGVPGALTNQPPERAVALPPGAPPARAGAADAAAGANVAENTSRQTTRNYEIDRTVAYTRQPAGRLKRLTVAVLVDNVRVVGQDGKITETALTPQELERITGLVKDAVGFDAQRGDSVNVMNAPWKGEPLITGGEVESIPLWQQPWIQDLARVVAGLVLALIVIFVVLRPMLKQLLATQRPVLLQTPAVAGAGALPAGEMAVGAGANGALPPGVTPGTPGASLAYEQQLAQARSLVAQDPARVAQVVKNWVAKDE
jgi:flagellar M-ring protein FliF